MLPLEPTQRDQRARSVNFALKDAASFREWNDLPRLLFAGLHFSGPRYLRYGLPDCLQVLTASAYPCFISILLPGGIVAAYFQMM
jgi:hypothetical protein